MGGMAGKGAGGEGGDLLLSSPRVVVMGSVEWSSPGVPEVSRQDGGDMVFNTERLQTW